MDLKVQDIALGAVVGLEGEIDLYHSPSLKQKLTEVAKKKPGCVILNFAAVKYIDSSGLATIIDLYQQMKVYGGKLALSNLSVPVRSVFEVARLHQVFAIYDSEEQAVEKLK
jgi:anti-sigma B factor antagonist